MYLILNYKKMPPKEWCHDPKIKNIENSTVEDYFIYNNMKIP